MESTIDLVAIVGSLRSGSFTRMVLNAAVELVPDGVSLTEIDLHAVPFYNGDIEEAGDPDPVVALKTAVSEADGFVIFTPEYNSSIPAVTKNAIDWLSRMRGDSALANAVVGAVTVTPGRHGGVAVQAHLGDSLLPIVGRLYETMLGVASIRHRITDDRLTDPEARHELSSWLTGFVASVKAAGH